jgi:integrase
MRVGELCALRWRDWTQELGTLSIVATRNISKNRKAKGKGDLYIPNENPVKNYHSRTIALSEAAANVLSEMKRISPRTSGDDYILLNRRGRPTNPSNYDANIRGLYREANLPDEISGAHILRRTCATKMHDEGCRIEDIAAYLGDAPETIQKHYVSLTKRIMADGEVKNVVQLPRKQ